MYYGKHKNGLFLLGLWSVGGWSLVNSDQLHQVRFTLSSIIWITDGHFLDSDQQKCFFANYEGDEDKNYSETPPKQTDIWGCEELPFHLLRTFSLFFKYQYSVITLQILNNQE